MDRQTAFFASRIWFGLGTANAVAGLFFLGAGVVKRDVTVIGIALSMVGLSGVCYRQMLVEHALGRTLPAIKTEDTGEGKLIEVAARPVKVKRLDLRL